MMQDTNNECVTFGSEGSLSQSGAKSTERPIYSEVPPHPSSDEMLKPDDVGLTVVNGDVETEENDRDAEQSQEQAVLEESNKGPPAKPPHTRPEDPEEQPQQPEIGDNAFFDMTRMKSVLLLVFPSIFSCGAKISLWILITYLILSGPANNLVENMQKPAARQAAVRNITQYAKPIDPWHYLNKTANETSKICQEKFAKAQQECSVLYDIMETKCQNALRVFGVSANRCPEVIIERRALCVHVSTKFILSSCINLSSDVLHELTTITRQMMLQESIVESSSSEENCSKEDNNIHTQAAEQQIGHGVVVKVSLALLIFAILYEAYRYHKHYLVYIEFDNCYLTLHFASIENNRRANGAAGVMPLKKSESQLYIQPTSCGLSRAEKESVLKYMIIFLVHLAVALVFILWDHFYHANRSEERRLDTRDNKTLSGVCGPQLKSTDGEDIVIISVLLGILLLLILLQPYALRLRHYIAGRFYETRERTRIEYLYYKLLEERKAFYKSTIERINKSSEGNTALKQLDAMLVLAQRFPAFGRFVGFLGVSLKRCVVCGTGLNQKCVMCDTEECNAVYCRKCFRDLESNCPCCMSRQTRLFSTRSRAEGNEDTYL